MLFRNLCIYRLPQDWDVPAAGLEAALEARPLPTCGHFDMSVRGWVPVGPTARMLHTLGQHQLVALGVEQKLLPSSVIRQEAADRAVDIAAQQGYPVGRRQMRELKREVTEELLARALVKRRITTAWIDRENGLFAVDASGTARAEEVIETLRETLGSFAVTPLDAAQAPKATLASWVATGHIGHGFQVDQDLELQALDLSRATIRYIHHAFDVEQVRKHLAGGFGVTRLGLCWNGRIGLSLTDKLQVKRVQFLDLEKDSEAPQDADPQVQFDSDFVLMSGELGALLADLQQALAPQT